jgi:hypothetical protein
MYNYTSSQGYTGSADTNVGGDTYWNSGESWGLVLNESSPDANALGQGRFYYYAGDHNCVVDKVTGLLWNNVINISSTNSPAYMMANPPAIVCNNVIVANSTGTGAGVLAKSRLPSVREIMSIVDLRYNAPNGQIFVLPAFTPSALNGKSGTSIPTPSGSLSSTVNYFNSLSSSGTYANVISGSTLNTFMFNGSYIDNYLGISMYSNAGVLNIANPGGTTYLNYLSVATLPSSVINPLQPLLKSLDPSSFRMTSYNPGDAAYQESPG